LLRCVHPQAELGENWVLLPSFVLPQGRFNRGETPVLFVIPVGYPNTGQDNFFVHVSLQLKGDGLPAAFNPNANSSSGPAPVPGEWGWFSWHPQSWRPAANPRTGDNLVTFVTGIGICLRGEEST
jgi:hypothetical protein